MSESLINYKIGGDKQLVFLGTERIVGVQTISVAQNPGLQALSYAGRGVDTVKYVPIQEQNASVNIGSLLINKDYFLDLVTGNTLHNMYIMKEKNDFNTNYSLVSGYFNSFTCSYSIGAVPQTAVYGVFIRDCGQIGTGSLPFSAANQLDTISTSNVDVTGTPLIPYGNNINLEIDTFSGNRLQTFNINVEANKLPVYNAGSKFPKKIELIYPINVEVSFVFEVGAYNVPRLRNMVQSGITKNINFIIGDYSTNATICNYSFNNMNLVSENYSAEINGFVNVQQAYQTKIYS